MRLRVFAILTTCGFLIFAFTMTFVPSCRRGPTTRQEPTPCCPWRSLVGRSGRISVEPISASVLCLLHCGCWPLVGVLPRGPGAQAPWPDDADADRNRRGEAPSSVADRDRLFFAVARICGESSASLYIRKGRLILGLSVGVITAAALLVLSLLQPAVRALGSAKFMSLAPWILLFVVSNAFMEELLFRGLFSGATSH